MSVENKKTSEKTGQGEVIHGAIWFGIPAMIVYDIACLAVYWVEGSSTGLSAFAFVVTAYSAFFSLACIFRNFNKSVMNRTTGGWMYAVAMGINYLFSLTVTIVSVVNLFTRGGVLNIVMLIVSALFFFMFNVNDIINTIITVKKLSAARKNTLN